MQLRQQDFAAGPVRGVARHLIPEQGVYSIENGLLDDDGSIYRRGGSEYVSTAFGAALTWIWDGYLAGGQRTVFASAADFGVLAANDTTPINLGGAGLTAPVRPVVLDGILFIPGARVLYGGSRMAADYSTGTITATNGSKTITGAGTLFLANVDKGMLLRVAGRYYAVESVDSNTQLTLHHVYHEGGAAGLSYTLTRLGSAATHGVPAGDVYAAVANRLLVGSGEIVRFSRGIDSVYGEFVNYQFDANDEHTLPAGSQILSIDGIRDRAIVGTTAGVWMISNMAFNIVDFGGNPGHRVELVTGDVVPWGAAGVAAWRGALVMPDVADIYLLDGLSQPTPISRSARKLYRGYIAAGYKPGGSDVYNAHYFLPILDGSNVVVDTLVFRLDRPVDTSLGTVFPWSQVNGHAGAVPSVALRVGSGAARQPELRAAGPDQRVLRISSMFVASTGKDADGSAYEWITETRDYPTDTGRGVENVVLRMIARYELAAAVDLPDPLISAYASVGRDEGAGAKWGQPLWGSFVWSDASLSDFVQLSGQAPVDDGRTPWAWQVIKSGRYVRFRLRSSDPATKLVLRSIDVFTRERGR